MNIPVVPATLYASVHRRCPFCGSGPDRQDLSMGWAGWSRCPCGRLMVEGFSHGPRRFVLLQSLESSPSRLLGTPGPSEDAPYVLLCDEPWAPGMRDPRHRGHSRPVALSDLGSVLRSFVAEAVALEVMGS